LTAQDFIVLFQEALGKKVQLPLLFGSHVWEKVKKRLEEL